MHTERYEGKDTPTNGYINKWSEERMDKELLQHTAIRHRDTSTE